MWNPQGVKILGSPVSARSSCPRSSNVAWPINRSCGTPLRHYVTVCAFVSFAQKNKQKFFHFLLCWCLSSWAFLDGPRCLFRLRPRLAIARHILRCALPLASRGGILGPLTLITFSFALTFAELNVSTLHSRTLRAIGQSWCHSHPSLFSSAKSDVISRSFNIRRWLIASSTQFDGSSRFSLVP